MSLNQLVNLKEFQWNLSWWQKLFARKIPQILNTSVQIITQQTNFNNTFSDKNSRSHLKVLT